MDEGTTQPASGLRPTASTAPLSRDRVDRIVLRALGERRVYRMLRHNGTSSAWDRLEQLVAHAATSLWESDLDDSTCADLSGYCAFLARELELNEQLDLEPERDLARLRTLAPRALEVLEAVTARHGAVHGAIADAFHAIRAELSSFVEAPLAIAA